VLLLHGLASTRHIWDLVVPHLSGCAVVAVDQRGHGDSERPAGPYDGATVAQDLLTALDALGLSRVVVVGHSWGATTALRLAADSPGRVLACVMIDGGLGGLSASGPTRAEARERLPPPRTALPPEQLRARLRSGPLAPWWSDAVEQSVLPLFEVGDDGLARARLPFEAHMQLLDGLLDTDHEALCRRAACPTWLVSCVPPPDRPDRSVAAVQDHALGVVACALARPRLLRWEGAVHDVPLQWPALVAGVVRAARDEVAAESARPVPAATHGKGRSG